WNTTMAGNGQHVLTAQATAGTQTTTASPVTVTVHNVSVSPSDVATRFEDTELSIAYIAGTTEPGRPAGWWHGSRSRDWSGGTASFNRSAGARASFAFNGTAVRWIGFRAPWAGIADVYIDGMLVSEVDLYAP